MNSAELLRMLVSDYTLRTVALGAATIGGLAGALGCFAVLRRQSLLGDAISHAALPGIGIAFLLTGSRATPVLVLGAAIAGWLGALAVLGIVRGGRLSEDSALGIVLSVFFGFGLVILTFIQRRPDAAQAGLETFLWGQAATLVAGDVLLIAGVGGGALLLLLLLWKEFKLLTFDSAYAASLGFGVARIEVALTFLLVTAIVLGLQTVGVVLMSALVVAPAAAARQWTDSLGVLVTLAGILGAGAGIAGALISATGQGIPTGPTIVLVAGGAVAVSLLLAPRRGLLAEGVRRIRMRHRIRADVVLEDLYTLQAQHEGTDHPHPVATLRTMASGRVGVEASLRRLLSEGLAREVSPDGWVLTEEGVRRARNRFRSSDGDDEAEAEGR